MGFFKWIKKGIRITDLFYSSQMLRFNNQMEYRTLTGGLFSLAIIIAVLMGFYNMIIDTFSLNSITFLQTIIKETDPSPASLTIGEPSQFMIAVQLWGVNLTRARYFDILMIQLNTTNGQSQASYELIPLTHCTKQHWAGFPQIVADFDKLSMSNWLCPPLGAKLNIEGRYSSNVFNYINISVNHCLQWLDPSRPCATDQQVKALFEGRDDAILFKIYYTNPLINAGNKQYKSHYLQTSNYAIFGSTIGGQSYIYVSDYKITTDYSIWPYENKIRDNGLLIQDKIINHPYTTFIGTYACYLIVKSSTSYKYDRQVQKISTVFSFMGGLISAFTAGLFILKLYNSLSFQITIALSIFKPPGQADTTVTKSQKQIVSMNFFNFLRYYIYILSRKIGWSLHWPKISFIRDCQSQILKQLDIKSLIKRVIFLQYCITNIFDDFQLDGLQSKKPSTPQEIRTIREKCQSIDSYYQNENQQQTENKLSKQHKSAGSFQQNQIVKEDKMADSDSSSQKSAKPINSKVYLNNGSKQRQSLFKHRPIDSINQNFESDGTPAIGLQRRLDGGRRLSPIAKNNKRNQSVLSQFFQKHRKIMDLPQERQRQIVGVEKTVPTYSITQLQTITRK